MNTETKSAAALGLALLLCATAGAQTYTELIREGDPVPGAASGELVALIDNVDVNRHGDWLVELNGDGATTGDQYVLHNGVILWQEGTDMGFNAPAGKEASSFVDVMDINDSGDILFITPVRDVGTTSTNGYLMVWNGVTVVEDDVTPCGAPSLPPGTIWSHVNEAWQNNNRQLLVQGSVFLGGSPLSTNIMLRMDLDASGNIVNEVKLALEGETLPGPNHVTPIQGFSASKGRQAINDNGECMWYVDDEHSTPPGSTLSDSNMYLTDAAFNNTLLYNEADQFPTDLADTFDHFSTAEIDLNDNGDFVFSGFDRGPSADDSWIFKSIGGVLTVLAHEGDPVPASIGGGWLTAGFGFGGVVPMSDSGDVLWYIDWDDPNTDVDTGLMFNDTLILQEGVSMLGGAVLEDVPNSDSEIAMSDDGGTAIIEVVLDGATDLDAVYLVSLSVPIGANYCTALPNSSGFPALISAVGSESASANNVTLTAEDLPVGEFGYFLAGQMQGSFTPPGSQGIICLAGNIGRYNAVAEIITGPSGSLQLDLMAIPVNPPQPALAGETWNFQCWFRDNNPMPTSNFTDGLTITFN